MGVMLLLGLLAVCGGVWMLFAVLWLMFRITFWFIGGLLGLLAAGLGLFALGAAAMLILPLAGLVMLPFAFPLLLIVGLIWVLTRSPVQGPRSVTLRP